MDTCGRCGPALLSPVSEVSCQYKLHERNIRTPLLEKNIDIAMQHYQLYLPDSAWHMPGRKFRKTKMGYTGMFLRCRSTERLKLSGASTNEQMVAEMSMEWHERLRTYPRTIEWINQWVDEPMNQQSNDSTKQWLKEAMTQWINGPMNRWINKPMSEWLNEWINGWMNEWMVEWMNKGMNEWTAERTCVLVGCLVHFFLVNRQILKTTSFSRTLFKS